MLDDRKQNMKNKNIVMHGKFIDRWPSFVKGDRNNSLEDNPAVPSGGLRNSAKYSSLMDPGINLQSMDITRVQMLDTADVGETAHLMKSSSSVSIYHVE